MINLHCYLPGAHDPTSFYRGWGPISMLRKQMPNLLVQRVEQVNWMTAFEADVALVQRPCSMEHINCINLLKEHGTPVWIDYDDDYINTSKNNPRYGTGLDLRMAETVKQALKLADVVTVTNEHLKRTYSEFNSNIKVIPNAMDDRLLGLQKESVTPVNAVLWRGNDLQKRDIGAFKKEILHIYRNGDTCHWNWMFAGWDPHWITDEMESTDPKRLQKRPGIEMFEYHRQLCETNWGIIIKPLEDNTFNRSRSNITWFEACMSGSVCIAPKWESWTDYSCPNSLVTYESPDEFKKQITHFIKHPGEIIQKVVAGREFIKKNYLLSTINKLRREIILELLNKYTEETINGERTSDTNTRSSASSTGAEIIPLSH